MLARPEVSVFIQAENLTGSNVTEFSRRIGLTQSLQPERNLFLRQELSAITQFTKCSQPEIIEKRPDGITFKPARCG